MKRVFKRVNNAFNNLGVSNKIIAITAISSLITLSILCTISFNRERSSFADRKVTELQTLARILSRNTVASLRFDDPVTALEYVESLQHDPDIETVSIYDSEGNLFSHYSRSLTASSHPAPDFAGERWEEDSLFYGKTVALNGVAIGSILLEMNTNSLKQATRESLTIALLLLLGGLAITILLVRRMQRTITDPIKELGEFSEAISKRKDYTQRLQKHGNDEIGAMIDSFNHMLETVQKHDQSLRNINLSLGRIVEGRTKDLRSRNEELREATEAAQAASKAKSDFLATISHELRTPMTAIVGLASELNEADLDQEVKDSINTINNSSDILLDLINDLLDFSKIESGKLELENREFDLLRALEESVEISVSKKQSPSVTVQLHCSNKLPQFINGDIVRFKQIVRNLLSNALKFTKEGTITLEAKLSSHKKTPKLRISIKDTGIGIPPEKLDTLFSQFTQADSSTTRRFGGTGLGLAITKRLVKAMGGNIQVTSKPQSGSTFEFEIPLLEDKESKPASGQLPDSVKAIIHSVNFHEIDKSIQGSIEKNLSNWGCEKDDFNYDLTVSSVIEETAEAAIAKAENLRSEVTGMHLIICNRSHLAKLKGNGFKHLLPTPLLVSTLKNALIEFVTPNSTPPEKAPPLMLKDSDLKIMLVEDHKINQKVFASLMKKEGYIIDTADHGQDGLEQFTDKEHDLIFMDMHMPVMDGVECTKRIRAQFPKEKQPWIIAFTANVQKSAAHELIEAGVNDIIYKPIKKPELRNAIESCRLKSKAIRSSDCAN